MPLNVELQEKDVAVVDFGFNNCGTFYIDPEDFDFI